MSAAEGKWQPIETAPRDGTRIIGWFGDRCIAVFWRCGPGYKADRGTTVWYWSDGYSRYREPDFWQPEPAPPEGMKAAAPFASQEPVKHPSGQTLGERRAAVRERMFPKTWCSQCERRMSAKEIDWCASPFCKLKREAA